MHMHAPAPSLQYRGLPASNLDIPTLNELLKSPELWGGLADAGLRHVLFFQTDSLLVHGGVAPFLQVCRRAGGGRGGGCSAQPGPGCAAQPSPPARPPELLSPSCAPPCPPPNRTATHCDAV